MDWGVHLPHLGRQVDRQTLMDFAQEIERLGCHSGWVSDHICWPAEIQSKYPYTDDGSFQPQTDMGWLDPISTMTFVAACTETLRLGSTVLILPYRMPVQTAKQIASLDVLSGGRADPTPLADLGRRLQQSSRPARRPLRPRFPRRLPTAQRSRRRVGRGAARVRSHRPRPG